MTTGRALVPAQTAPTRTMPSRGELVRILRQLRALCFTDNPLHRHAVRAYDESLALGDHPSPHRLDLQL